ncbi:MAG TPA: histidine kinase dimerization/phosphoacceptor domain -containing protein [Novosphingobium sp.]|nr:histidine kinase dimerization/phosphoacceptor domain -containing protein [Novosphingobium sp.]
MMADETARILYIDDDEGLCHLARRALGRLGYAVEIATSGPQGVDLAAAGPFDLVALDHYMPGQDGLATLAALGDLPAPPPVVYVTGSDESAIAVAALKAGAVDYVVKSVSEDFFDLLASAIEQALAAQRLRAEKEEAEHRLRETNAQLEMMLGEVNHRVANSLQMVSALVSMQARKAEGEEARALLADTRRRIHAIAQVHRQLYAAGGATSIAIADYIRALAAELEHTCSTPAAPRRILVDAQPAMMPASIAVALGVIINELVSNACKYAYGEHEPGQVRLTFATHGTDGFLLALEDDGRGMAQGATPKGTGLGSQIIRAMAQTLKADLRYINKTPGLRVELEREEGQTA